MKTVHLWAAALTAAIVIAASTAGVSYATGVEREYIHGLAPLRSDIAITGNALQQAAFSQPDLLPIFGASEELFQGSKYQATQFFKTYPTGFALFEGSFPGSASIIHAESIAALGPDVRGKKVVFSFTPEQFTDVPGSFTGDMMDSRAYETIFSRLDANELVFNAPLSYETKQIAARRMLQYPDTLKSDPILKFALEQLAADTLLSRVLYYVSCLLGKLQVFIMELQDHYATVAYIQSLKHLSRDYPHRPQVIDWNAKLTEARQEQLPQSTNNPYGFDDSVWDGLSNGFKVQAIPSGDASFLHALDTSVEWDDLELLLKITKELGAQPLLVGRPMNARYYHDLGVSDSAMQQYYIKLNKLASQYGVQVVDFQNFQDDIHFGVDPLSHTSRVGWVYVDQALDAFYHQAER